MLLNGHLLLEILCNLVEEFECVEVIGPRHAASTQLIIIIIIMLYFRPIWPIGKHVYGPFLLKLLVTVKIMCKKKVFQMCNKCCQGCSGEH